MLMEMLINHIIEKYSQNMGWYFDEYQGQEEEAYNETYCLFKNSNLKDKLRLLRGTY